MKARPRLLIAGTHSGCGKTTVTQGILGALVRRGLRVQAFKSGPDYIDPGHHALVTGRPGRNLDTWMLSPDSVVELFQRSSLDADINVIEGAMGLYDGYDSLNEIGSAAYLAKLLNCPVILVVDASGVGRSAAATVFGYARFPNAPFIAGVVLNNVSGEGHVSFVAPEIEALGIPVVGWMPCEPMLRIGERHLGLNPAEAGGLTRATREAMADNAEQHINLHKLLDIANCVPSLPELSPILFAKPAGDRINQAVHKCRIGYARDEAFHFYYQDNLDLLEHLGAECVPFSPLRDSALPPDVGLLYFGGGYPETYAEELAANMPMLEAVREWSSLNRPVYAECGGLMYLGKSLCTLDGRNHEMAATLPIRTRMNDRLAALGYTTVVLQRGCPLGPCGRSWRAHEFHWSTLAEDGEVEYAFSTEKRGRIKQDGVLSGQTLAGYTHTHFASCPSLADALVATARESSNR
jgi:cobyrinic acid a,c-diamide synthase